VTATSDRRVATDEVAHLYRQHHRDLQRAVAAAVRAPRELIEDACQNAWTIMLRSQPRRATWFAWLRVVAIHQAREQCAQSRNERPAGGFISPDASEIGPYEYRIRQPTPGTFPTKSRTASSMSSGSRISPRSSRTTAAPST
jgi:DNA-directed RNA polymerase specialized sigma24 family protein